MKWLLEACQSKGDSSASQSSSSSSSSRSLTNAKRPISRESDDVNISTRVKRDAGIRLGSMVLGSGNRNGNDAFSSSIVDIENGSNDVKLHYPGRKVPKSKKVGGSTKKRY